MTTKAQEAKVSETIIEYDAAAPQIIPLTLNRNGKDFTVKHFLGALTDERYLQFQDDLEKTVGRFKKLSTAIHTPKTKLWADLAEKVEGYKPRDDWQNGVHQTHKSAAISALCDVQMLDQPDEAEESTEEFWDIDAPIIIPFRAMFAGTLLLNMSHIFWPESSAAMDEFMAIESQQPNDKELASAQRLSHAEKLARLGRRLLVDQKGYKDGSSVPVWHLAPSTEAFFLRQIAQTGKSLA